ncbi:MULTISPECIES: 2-hydroxyacid dehydrogenase [unclassified Sinorhizobium]|uniref:2-hydroxyacid dehydrogenase n=1 Tax=unclassified Sinorhizobium TaxID=2613772 RepID=UPI0035260FA8
MPERSSVIIDLKFDPQIVATALSKSFQDRETINLADPRVGKRDLKGIDYAVIWKPQPDLFARAPDLKVIFSGGAGVDHILATDGLPDVPLVRFVDESLTTRMSEWVVLQCLAHLRQVRSYERQARDRIWRELPQPEAKDVTVGIMGMGVLGQDAARKLKLMGFDVIGWSRRKHEIQGIETFDADGLDAFLARTDFLVGLLPLTVETTGIFDKKVFSKLRQGGPLGKPVFINAGRGKSQVETDLTAALTDGILGGASLDVFEIEPLPAASPFWAMENVILTPHAAAASDVDALFRHVETQIGRFERGEPLQYLVDRAGGY